jgi:hypothetical protein
LAALKTGVGGPRGIPRHPTSLRQNRPEVYHHKWATFSGILATANSRRPAVAGIAVSVGRLAVSVARHETAVSVGRIGAEPHHAPVALVDRAAVGRRDRHTAGLVAGGREVGAVDVRRMAPNANDAGTVPRPARQARERPGPREASVSWSTSGERALAPPIGHFPALARKVQQTCGTVTGQGYGEAESASPTCPLLRSVMTNPSSNSPAPAVMAFFPRAP